MKFLDQKLKDIFNLRPYEAKVFVTLCDFEKANITEIAKSSQIPRTAIYSSINSLLEKGLISQVLFGRRKYYKALSPNQLEAMFHRKKIDLSFLINELSSRYSDNNQKMEVLYFPGKNGLNSAAESFLKNTKSKLWKTFESSVVNQPALEFYQLEDYILRRVEKDIHCRVIMTINIMYPFLRERLNKDNDEKRETILISEKTFPFPTVIGINEDSVLILSGEGTIFGALIKNVQFARTLSTIHDLIWGRYRDNK